MQRQPEGEARFSASHDCNSRPLRGRAPRSETDSAWEDLEPASGDRRRLCVGCLTGTVFPVVFLVGLTSISYMTATTAIVQVRSDPQMQGRVIALQTVLLVGIGLARWRIPVRALVALGIAGTVLFGSAQILRAYEAPEDEIPTEYVPARREAARRKFAELLDAAPVP